MKNAEFVSRITNDLNALTKDVHLSKRWILNIGQTKAESYVAQHWDEGGMWDDHSLLTCIPCVEMIEVDKVDCCDAVFELCGFLMRSKYRLPGLVYSSRGAIITHVSTVDNSRFYKKADIKTYRIQSKRKYAGKLPKFYYVYDGYIYIPDEHIELINVCYFTLKRKEALALSACEPEATCDSVWDDDFVFPVKLIEYIAQETLNEVSTKLKIPADERPDLDSNVKTKTVQE